MNNKREQKIPKTHIKRSSFRDFHTVVLPRINFGKVINSTMKGVLDEINEHTKIPFFIAEDYWWENDIALPYFDAIGNTGSIKIESFPKFLNREHYDLTLLFLRQGGLMDSVDDRLRIRIKRDDSKIVNLIRDLEDMNSLEVLYMKRMSI